MAEFYKQLDVFHGNGVDFMIAEYFEHIEEAEWAVEQCLNAKYNFKNRGVQINMCIGPEGDLHGNNMEQCQIRMQVRSRGQNYVKVDVNSICGKMI